MSVCPLTRRLLHLSNHRVYASYAANHAEALMGLEKLGPVVNKYIKENPLAGGLTLQR